MHHLPIERGRYSKPPIPRASRWCALCKKHIGSEFHVLMECEHHELKNLRNTHLNRIITQSPQLGIMNGLQTFMYIMACTDMDIIKDTIDWIVEIDTLHKKLNE